MTQNIGLRLKLKILYFEYLEKFFRWKQERKTAQMMSEVYKRGESGELLIVRKIKGEE